ncbi:MAG: DNA-binding protein [Sulfolobales archaeon]|jgi:nucleoid protein Alba|nr:DNA-binding protein [Sulfolobales archaeon]PVU72399.1 DNA-binding protein [Sulfolobales archaeon SCGC AB-777_J03]MCQ4366037.1 DNA-binding protein [Sulfolobales archaeon]MCQ4447654.1 DNA-binding protein [Sulfolobales archaeon]MCQ4449452.1 DNA-binding protein [Sulfolobales archaeon]
MSRKYVEVVVSRTKSVSDYVLDIITLMNQGFDEVKIKGLGREISKAVDVYNSLKSRMENGVELKDVQIGTDKERKRTSYILITVVRKY